MGLLLLHNYLFFSKVDLVSHKVFEQSVGGSHGDDTVKNTSFHIMKMHYLVFILVLLEFLRHLSEEHKETVAK